jgi:hypothetical protein
MWHFFARILTDALRLLAPDAMSQRVALVLVCAFLMFGYFGSSGLIGFGDVSQTLSGISVLAIPVGAAANWPSSKPGTHDVGI